VRGIVSTLQVHHAETGAYPGAPDDVPVAEYVAGLGGAGQLRYMRSHTRGFVLRFAGQDGEIDTADDRIEYGITP